MKEDFTEAVKKFGGILSYFGLRILLLYNGEIRESVCPTIFLSKTKMAITQSIFKLEPPDFAW